MSSDRTDEAAPQDDVLGLARAFATATYRVELGGEPEIFHVGERVPAIESRLPAASYAFITAWNPDAETQPVTDNARSDDGLAARLEAGGFEYRRVWAQDAQGGHREAGWLVAGIAPERADALGREFEQAGILAWSQSEPVRLHMLVPRPDDAPSGLEHVDWVE